MKLYYAPGACSLAPHITAREGALSVEVERVDLRAKTTADGSDFKAINPKGYVPALRLDDGTLFTECAAMLQLLADQNPAAGLLPAHGTMDRYRAIEWLTFISTELHKGWSPLWVPTNPDAVKDAARARIALRLATIEEQLTAAPFVTGATFSVADAYLYTVLRWSAYTGVDLTPFPAVQAWMGKIGERPAVRAALQEQGLAA